MRKNGQIKANNFALRSWKSASEFYAFSGRARNENDSLITRPIDASAREDEIIVLDVSRVLLCTRVARNERRLLIIIVVVSYTREYKIRRKVRDHRKRGFFFCRRRRFRKTRPRAKDDNYYCCRSAAAAVAPSDGHATRQETFRGHRTAATTDGGGGGSSVCAPAGLCSAKTFSTARSFLLQHARTTTIIMIIITITIDYQTVSTTL